MLGRDHLDRAAKRPLRELTDHELDVLDELGREARIFRAHLSSPLYTLGDFAARELANRDIVNDKYVERRRSDV